MAEEVQDPSNEDVETAMRDLQDGARVNVFGNEEIIPDDNEQKLARLDEVAREVLEGKWGTGQKRRMALAEAGLDPVEVQRQMVRIVNQTP